MCPSAVDSELDLTLKAVGNVLELDFPNVVSNLVHLVNFSCGIPSYAVEPVTFAVTYSEYRVIFELSDLFNDIAFNIGVVLSGIVNYCKCTCACEVEGNVVACLVANPLSTVLNGLELNCTVSFVNGVILGECAVFSLCHEVSLICAIPCCAEDLSLAASYDVGVILSGLCFRLCFGSCC